MELLLQPACPPVSTRSRAGATAARRRDGRGRLMSPFSIAFCARLATFLPRWRKTLGCCRTQAVGRRDPEKELMRILVVEDDEKTLQYLATGLEQEGHLIDAVQSGTEGLELALSRVYDVLVVDRMLPILDGLTLVRTLRSKRIWTPFLSHFGRRRR